MKVTIPEPIQPEPTIDNKLEILKFASQVQSRIKEDISEDFILAKLGEQDKEGIIEMTSNAYFVKKILMLIKETGKRYEWDNNTRQWSEAKLTDKQKEFIQKVADTTFDSYLTRIFMTVILNRNVKDNHLLKILAGVQDEEKDDGMEGVKGEIKKLLEPKEEKQ